MLDPIPNILLGKGWGEGTKYLPIATLGEGITAGWVTVKGNTTSTKTSCDTWSEHAGTTVAHIITATYIENIGWGRGGITSHTQKYIQTLVPKIRPQTSIAIQTSDAKLISPQTGS